MTTIKRKTRDVISELVLAQAQGVHVSAQELQEQAGKLGTNVSLSTVYRVLEQLKERGLVSSIISNKGHLWEAAGKEDPHDHIICTRCGITKEFTDTLVSGFGRTVAERKGFIFQGSRFDIFGFCSSCKHAQDQVLISALEEIITEARLMIQDSDKLLSAPQESYTASDNRLRLAREQTRKALEKIDQAIRILE